MTYSNSKLKNYINVRSINEFLSLLEDISPSFFVAHFANSKASYLSDITRLVTQIDNDFHYVYFLKQEKYLFQLKWKESVFKAHIELLLPQFPKQVLIKKVG